MLKGVPACPQFTEVVAAQFTCGTSAAALGNTSLGLVGLAMLQADPANSGTIKIGDAGGQYVTLAAGNWFPFLLPLENLNVVYAKGSASNQLLNALIVK